MESSSRGVLDTPLSRSMTTECGEAKCLTASPSIQFLPALGHAIQKRPRLAVEKLHIRHTSASGGGVAGYGARAREDLPGAGRE
jgi:hypothetical protein